MGDDRVWAINPSTRSSSGINKGKVEDWNLGRSEENKNELWWGFICLFFTTVCHVEKQKEKKRKKKPAEKYQHKRTTIYILRMTGQIKKHI